MDEAPRTWKGMVEANQELLLRRTGHDVHWWADLARAQGFATAEALAAWLRQEHGVTGYAQSAVSWEVFGYPSFLLESADDLFARQYAGREHLKPLAEAILAWAQRTPGVVIQMRAGYVSLQSPRRKFAQIAARTKSAVEVTLRWDGPRLERIEQLTTTGGDPFGWRIRLRSLDDVDAELFEVLQAALDQNR